jgi:hypothetical protein
MSAPRYERLPSRAAGGAKLCNRIDVNPRLSVWQGVDSEAAAALLAARFGPSDPVGSDCDYSYSIRDRKTGLEFEAYSGPSGPAYGGFPPESFVDFENGDYTTRPEILAALREFEDWLEEPMPPLP